MDDDIEGAERDIACPRIGDLPRELIFHIVAALEDDTDFYAARLAHPCFCVHTRDELHRDRREPRWRSTTPAQLCETAGLDAVRFLCKTRSHKFCVGDIEAAVRGGRPEVVGFVCSNTFIHVPEGVLDYAAEHADLDVFLAMLTQIDARCTFFTMNYAARGGRLDTVKWLHAHSAQGCTRAAMDYAAAGGHMDVLRFLDEHRTEGCSTDAIDFAAANGHLEAIAYVIKHRGARCTKRAFNSAAHAGHADVLRFLAQHFDAQGARARVVEHAARAGHVDIIAYAHSRWPRRDICTSLIDDAAGAGHLDMVMFLHENGISGGTTRAIDLAASKGHIDVVRFLHSRTTLGCTPSAMDDAAAGGHLEVVRFLHEHRTEGCTERAMYWAAFYGHLEVVRFLDQHRSALDDLPAALNAAACNGHLPTVVYLCGRCRRGRHSDAMEKATTYDHVNVVKWLYENCPGIDAGRALKGAVRRGHARSVIRYLWDKCSAKDLSEATALARGAPIWHFVASLNARGESDDMVAP
ncbi:Ankyrin repeat domain containing protein [Pandoravirus dulcis]|uniref:Ankyrin repeat domain containing protein n=1 Tax=Pandoravirus dulcis TaxID=1349409 RepID=S4VRC7_9VIRU|nr:Ankyrin repeat domain containing protein [Pandoravirus dulcis]AGO82837.1 Ankyrin repeat domain containing protein [Pandoravirus dulcis]